MKPLLTTSADKGDALIRIPPFRDAHMHFTMNGRGASEEELGDIIEAYPKAGIFAIRDMGHRTGVGLAAKKIAKREVQVKTAVFAISRRGGYGAFLGRPVSGEKEIRKAVKEIAQTGADFIKVINSGIVSAKENDQVTEGGFSREELKIICREAGERNLTVACHANSEKAIEDAVSAGVSSVEHGFFVTSEVLRMMAESGVSWTPTIFALAVLSDAPSPAERKYIEGVVARHLESVSYAASIGVKLNVGTDSGSRGVRHGESYVEELRLFRRAGLSLDSILTCACMDRSEIERGNYLLVGEDFITAGKVAAVYKRGQPLLFAD
jgi:imidazolonepropionase-like amidohydrolase